MSSPESILSDIEGSPLEPPSPLPHAPPQRRTENKYDRLFGSDNDKEVQRRRGRNRDEADGMNEGNEDEADGDQDLFGDDSDADDGKRKDLSDAELEHTPEADQDDEPEKIYRTIDVSLPRHPVPDPGNNDLYILRVPAVVNLQPSIFYPENFVLPKAPADTTVSPYTLATTTIRVRKSPADPSTLQSNTRIIRWSDGSLSLQIASSPNLYDLTSKPLAPSHTPGTPYDASQDSHTYILTPHESAGMLRFLGHATQSLNVLPTSTSLANADAVTRLHEQLYAAQSSRGSRIGGAPQTMEITDMRDPEAERKEAEKLSRDKERLARKQEQRRARAARNAPGGADDERAAARRSYPRNSHTTRSKRDSPPIGGTKGGRSKEDEYDLEDDFVERSDDDQDGGVSESDDDDDDPRRSRQKSKKKAPAKKRNQILVEEEEEEEEEAEFTDDDARPTGNRGSRAGKRRRIIDDDDEDDE